MIKDKVSKNDFVLVDFSKKSFKKGRTLVPNVSGIAREMTGGSQIMIILKKFLSLGIVDMIIFGFNNILFLPQLLRMDYAAGVKVLCELEILKSRQRGQVDEFVMHSQMVDMAVALKNRKVVSNFLGLAKKYDFTPGLMSYNLAQLIEYLSKISKLPIDLKIYTKFEGSDSVQNFAKLSNINFYELSEK